MRSILAAAMFPFVLFAGWVTAQNFSFNFNSSGRRVCLVSSHVDLAANTVKIIFHDSTSNTSEPIFVARRPLGTTSWTLVANALPPGTGHWIDTNVAPGDIWEYQVKRQDTWSYQSINYPATGYTIGCLQSDQVQYKGQMILLVADDIPTGLPAKYQRLKKEITADGWLVNELVVPRATAWDSGTEVVTIKNQINALYTSALPTDKPKVLFILGHVPLPRCGSTSVIAPDDHNENKGARGCDAYYADLDGVFTDTATYNPGGLATPLAINLPGDFKWDQDFFPSDVEMAFGRIDFADITELPAGELALIEAYLDRLSNYRRVAAGHDMGDKTAFHFGYDNSNDGSYRSLPNISTPDRVFQNYAGANHNQWVQTNGPFKIYMQNVSVPEIADWQTFGMDATIYASDQSYWGFGDAPQPNGLNSRIRALLGVDSKCLIALWTTTGINIFHQACTGQAFGEAVKTIMNHNPTNQYLEKAPQDYDTQDWWNRTHFAFWGDPTLNLYQIAPPTNASVILDNNNLAVLQWSNSPDPAVIGYHVFTSTAELGKYERVTGSLITGNTFVLPNYQQGSWYMVKAVRSITSGCGTFLHGSIGDATQGNVVIVGQAAPSAIGITASPNPAHDHIQFDWAGMDSYLFTLTNHLGQTLQAGQLDHAHNRIALDGLPSGVYMVHLTGASAVTTIKVIKP